MAAFSLGVSLAVIIVVFFFSVNPLSFLLSVMALALKTPPLGGRGESRVSRLLRPAYSRMLCLPCHAQGQVFCALRPFILGIWLLKLGFALLLYTPSQTATNALTRRFGLPSAYFLYPGPKSPGTGHTGADTALALVLTDFVLSTPLLLVFHCRHQPLAE